MKPMDRREFVAATAAAALVSCARAASADEPRNDVSWLAEIQSPPKELPADLPRLSDLLVDSRGAKIDTLDAWQKRREELRQWWLKFLGKMPAERKMPPKLEVVEEDRLGGVVRQLVKYDVEPGISTEAYLCQPEMISGKVPAIAAFHSTVDHSIRQPAGIEGAPEKAFGLRYAKAGRIVFCPRNYLWPVTGKIAAAEEADKYLQRVPGSLGMAKMLYDALVAVDILAAIPDVDAERIGAVGHSLGAKEVLYLAALDERVKVTISSEGGIGTRFSNWDAKWYLGPAITEPTFTHEHHELLALAAPRPFLLIGGESADGDRGWPFIERALAVYKLYGEPCRVGQYNHRQGHAVPPEALARMDEWLDAYL
jgi:dienelactone hydrolase